MTDLSRLCLAVIQRVLGNPFDCDDCFQEFAIAKLQNPEFQLRANATKDPAKFMLWAANWFARDWRRKLARQRTVSLDQSVTPLPDQSPGIEAAIDADRRMAFLRTIVRPRAAEILDSLEKGQGGQVAREARAQLRARGRTDYEILLALWSGQDALAGVVFGLEPATQRVYLHRVRAGLIKRCRALETKAA